MQPAADQGRHAGGMMRCPKRPAVGKRAILDPAGDRRDHGDFEQLRRRKRRKNGRQARREHGFPGPWRANHQHIVLSMPKWRWIDARAGLS